MQIGNQKVVALAALALALALAGCMGGEITGGGGEQVSQHGLSIRIDAPTATDARVLVTYANESSKPLRLLRWTLPSDDLWQDIFDVSLDGVHARYIGRVYQRRDPRPEDYVTLAPGESLSGEVDLARLYELPSAGTYLVRARGDASVFTGRLATSGADAVASNEIAFLSEAHRRTAVLDQPYYYGISYSSCSSSQKQDLVTGMEEADVFAEDATSYFASTTPGNRTRYRKWFGSYSSSRWAHVRNVFDTLASRLAQKRMRFHCDCSDDYYAYVYPDQPYNIYICNIYWDASLEDKGGTIIHELTHFDAVGSTADVTYGDSACLDLARSDPSSAVNNADSYAYFVEEP